MAHSLVQSRLNFSQESAEVLAGVLLYLIPAGLTVLLLWQRRSWRPTIAVWRWRVWNGGLATGTAAAIAMPVFLLGIQFLSDAAKQRWFIDAGTKGMFFALLATPLAITMLAFGKGKQRWIGISSATLCFVELYVSLLAAST